MYDIVIIGGGPAGLTAALYARRAGKTAMIIEESAFGGQITWSPKVENFPTIQSISGVELADRLVEQVMALGVDLEVDRAVGVEDTDGKKVVRTAFGGEFECKAVIIATGAKPRKLGLAREDELIGNGISFCAVCDGAFYKGKTAAIVGGGNAALQEALFLADICSKVYLIHRRDNFRGEEHLAELLKGRANVELVLNSQVSEYLGEDALMGVKVTDKAGAEREIALDGVFIAVGHVPDTEQFSEMLTLDGSGYVDSDESCKTKTAGIFVAGDCRKKGVRQLTTAVADGTSAAIAACAYIDEQ